MSHALVLSLALVFLCVASSVVFAQNPDLETVKKFISAQASKEQGEEYEEARKVIVGDLNRDGQADLAVLYTIEGQDGTNNYIQYLAAFVRKSGALAPAAHQMVGGKNYRSVELQVIDKGVILLTTLSYTSKDPSCCPSRKGSASYQLTGGKLRVLRKLS